MTQMIYTVTVKLSIYTPIIPPLPQKKIKKSSNSLYQDEPYESNNVTNFHPQIWIINTSDRGRQKSGRHILQ